jgi:hypothetical protein
MLLLSNINERKMEKKTKELAAKSALKRKADVYGSILRYALNQQQSIKHTDRTDAKIQFLDSMLRAADGHEIDIDVETKLLLGKGKLTSNDLSQKPTSERVFDGTINDFVDEFISHLKSKQLEYSRGREDASKLSWVTEPSAK